MTAIPAPEAEARSLRGLFGGTFDPVHLGHLALARSARDAFALDRVDFIPCHHPVHRGQPGASPEQRRRMLELALQGEPGFVVNSVELDRDRPSWAVETLEQLRAGDPHSIFCWLMGADAWAGFERWREPERILELAHIVVCARPGVARAVTRFDDRFLGAGESLRSSPAGRVAWHAMPPNDCSSTRVCARLMAGEAPSDCLPGPVLEFIQRQGLYRAAPQPTDPSRA